MPGERDNRGFVIFTVLTDSYGAEVTVKESSSAEEPKCWIFVQGGAVDENKGSAHLTVHQAVKVRDALADFISSSVSRAGLCCQENPCLDVETCPNCKDFPTGSGG